MLIFLFGEDTYRSAQKVEELKTKFKRDVDPSGMAISVMDGSQLDVDDLGLKLLSGGGFFSAKKMIIIKNLMLKGKKATKDKVGEMLTQMVHITLHMSDKAGVLGDDIIIVIWEQGAPDKRESLFKICSQTKYTTEFAPLEGQRLSQWVSWECHKQGVAIHPSAQQLLESFVGNNLWQMQQEICKLVSFVSGKSRDQIEAEDVKELVQSIFNQNIFALMDALSHKESARTFALLSGNLNEGMESLYVLSMLARQFRILGLVKEATEYQRKSNIEIAKELRLHPFVVQKALIQARTFSWEELKTLYARLVEVDLWTKSTPLSGNELLFLITGEAVL